VRGLIERLEAGELDWPGTVRTTLMERLLEGEPD